MTAGQRAMAVAWAYREPEKGGRGRKGVRDGQVSHQRLSLARAVLRYSEEKAQKVLAGELTLDAAVREIEEEQGKDANRRSRQEGTSRTELGALSSRSAGT
jgi:hypothetical protein